MQEQSGQIKKRLENPSRELLGRKDERIAMLEAMLEHTRREPDRSPVAYHGRAGLNAMGALLQPPSGGARIYATPPEGLGQTGGARTYDSPELTTMPREPIRLSDFSPNVSPVAAPVMEAAARASHSEMSSSLNEEDLEPTARIEPELLRHAHEALHKRGSDSWRYRSIAPALVAVVTLLCVVGIATRRRLGETAATPSFPLSVQTRSVAPDDSETLHHSGVAAQLPTPPASHKALSAGPIIEAAQAQPPRPRSKHSRHPANAVASDHHPSSATISTAYAATTAPIPIHKHTRRLHRHYQKQPSTGSGATGSRDIFAGHPPPGQDEQADRWIDNLP